MGQGVQVLLVGAGLKVAKLGRRAEVLVVEMPASTVKESTTSQGTMKQVVAGDPERSVQGLVRQSLPDLRETWAKEAGGWWRKGLGSPIAWGRAGRAVPLQVQPSKLSEEGWVWEVFSLLQRGGLGMEGPSSFQLTQPAEGIGVISGVDGPNERPGCLLLLVTWDQLRRGHVVHVGVKEGHTSVPDANVEQVDLHTVDSDAPSSGIQLHIIPATNQPGLQDALPFRGRELLLGRILLEILSKPSALGL